MFNYKMKTFSVEWVLDICIFFLYSEMLSNDNILNAILNSIECFLMILKDFKLIS